MLELKEDKEIGEYLSKLIKKRGYKSKREFCKAYLKHEQRDVDEDEIRKMANRISQITKGAKGLQIYDLPVITDLLGVTCEELLSAGQNFVPNNSRPTNYSIAFSHKEDEWETFVNRTDNLMLNPDEYGKTVIDYALEFKNYKLLKYLLKEEYIWFDSKRESDYVMTFGAGTKIKHHELNKTDDHLQYYLATEDKLRISMISLAIENDDFEILDELHAREIPALYYNAHYLPITHPDVAACYDEEFVRFIAKASNRIIDYFTNPFEVKDYIKYKDGSSRTHKFIYPYISELLDFLILNKHDFTEIVLKKCIEYNNHTYSALREMIENAIKNNLERFSDGDIKHLDTIRTKIIDGVFKDYFFYENGNIISFRDTRKVVGIITNIARTKATSDDVKLKYLIEDLNQSFDKILNIRREFNE